LSTTHSIHKRVERKQALAAIVFIRIALPETYTVKQPIPLSQSHACIQNISTMPSMHKPRRGGAGGAACNIARWLLPTLSLLSLGINVVLFWSFNETTYDTYSGLRAATELEAREVDQLWEHGKALRAKVKRIEDELASFKLSLLKGRALRDISGHESKLTFNSQRDHVLEAAASASTVVTSINTRDEEKAPVDDQNQPVFGETAAVAADDITLVLPATRHHHWKLSRDEVNRAIEFQDELTQPVVKKFKLLAEQVAEAANLASKNNLASIS
jgi:hypothetical protein